MIKNILKSLVIIAAFCLPILSLSPVYADGEETPTQESEQVEPTVNSSNTTNLDKPKDKLNYSGDAPCPTFFGLKAWYCGLNLNGINDQEELKEGLIIIIINIIEDIFIVAGYVMLFFIIYGGFLYMVSSGEASKVMTGKKIMTNSIIGIIIIAASYIILNTIRIALLGNSGKFDNCFSEECITPEGLIGNALSWIFGIIAVIAVVFIIYGGISYMTSAGEPGKLKKAKDTILYAIIGLVIIALAYAITNFIISTINNSTSSQGLLQEEGTHEVIVS